MDDAILTDVPAPNEQRRLLLADAAVTLLARDGAHGLTHRSVEHVAGVPAGTASNYFPTRDDLFAAAATRVGQLHRRHMEQAETSRPRSLSGALAASLYESATASRDRYLAIFELQAESLRRPSLREPLLELQRTMTDFTAGHHRRTGVAMSPTTRRILMRLYGAALHSFVMQPPGTVDRREVNRVAAAIARGATQD